MHPKLKLLYDKRDNILRELNMEYYKLLLDGKNEKIISDYEIINKELPSIDPEKPRNLSAEAYSTHLIDNKEYLNGLMAFLNTAKDSFKECTSLVEKLKKEDLSSEDKFELSNQLASAKSCIDALIN
jgi:DNA-directed RNA polymerase subunit H (RpoH/RPB5)